MFALYVRLRREARDGGGILIPPETDPIVTRHLLAMERKFEEDRRKFATSQGQMKI